MQKCKECLIDKNKECPLLLYKSFFAETYRCGKIYFTYFGSLIVLFLMVCIVMGFCYLMYLAGWIK